MPVTLALTTLCENPAHRTGLSTLFQEFVRHARASHPQVEWIVFAGNSEPWPEQAGVRVCRDFPSNERPLIRLMADHLSVAGRARRLGAQALVTVGFYPLVSAGLPVVMHVFEVGHARASGAKAFYRKHAVARGLERASLVITNSAWARGQIGRSVAPIVVSPEGLQRDRFRPDGPRGYEGITGDYLLWSSNFYPYKRCGLAIAAYARLPASLRQALPLVLVGGDWSGGRGAAELAAREHGVADTTHFLGWVSDEALPGLYRGATAHLLPSSEETFGRSVLEAMACGCPCLLQDLPVFREVAADAADYVDFADTASAAAALEKLCTDRGYARTRAEAGLRAASAFSFERVARERVEAILTALRTPKP